MAKKTGSPKPPSQEPAAHEQLREARADIEQLHDTIRTLRIELCTAGSQINAHAVERRKLTDELDYANKERARADAERERTQELLATLNATDEYRERFLERLMGNHGIEITGGFAVIVTGEHANPAFSDFSDD